MKSYFKFPILFLILTTLTVFSCKEDEDPVEANRQKVTGDWKAKSLSQSNCNDEDSNAELIFGEEGACFEVFPGVEGCAIVDFTFNADGTIASEIIVNTPFGNQTRNPSGTWEILDETRMTACLPNLEGELECSTGTYTVTDTTLTYDGSSAESGCDISLTAAKE